MSYKNYNRIIFVHIPRTGGTSIRSVMNSYNKKKDLNFEGEHGYIETFNPNKNDFVFSFVRNPYDHLISFYEFHGQKAIKKYNFKDWIKNGCPTHWKFDAFPQHKYFVRDGKISLDFLGKHENLIEDFYKLLNILGLERKDFPRKRPSKRKNGSENFLHYYDNETIQIVNEKFHEDFVYFNYEKL